MRSTQRHNFLSNIRNFIRENSSTLGDDRLPIRGYHAAHHQFIELVEAPEGIKFLRTLPVEL